MPAPIVKEYIEEPKQAKIPEAAGLGFLGRWFVSGRETLRRFFKDPEIPHFEPRALRQKGLGFTYQGRHFFSHSKLHHSDSAVYSLIGRQKLWLASALVVFIIALFVSWHGTILTGFAVLICLYFLDLLFNLFLIFRSFTCQPEIKVSEQEIKAADGRDWPSYTIFCPLYKEWQVVPQFVKAMELLDYPKDKLQIMLLLEEDDRQTIDKVSQYNLPNQFQVVVVPHSMPKTKPKAMNYGLGLATGEFVVIYDAEDVPEALQLKKAVLAFEKSGSETVCVQAKLNFYNPEQNLLTRIFTAEYSLWFDLVLTGLQSINAPIPLGGTSNHFRGRDIKQLSGWDAFNVTEDCDLGMRLSKRGMRTAIIDSTTLEEANSDFKNWYRQRSRWIKGYIQTYMVHMRRPEEFIESGRLRDLVIFQMLVGGKILSMFINPFLWVITACYFLFRAHIGLFIESFFPDPILYIGVFSFVFGNFLYLYYYMVGCAKRGQYGIIKYAFLVPFYWLYMSAAAWQALYEVIVKPHYWAKTLHGLHLQDAASENLQSSALNSWGIGSLVKKHLTGGGIFIAGLLLANFFNFLGSAYLGRVLKFEDFGLITLFNTITLVANVFISGLSTTVNHRTAYIYSHDGLRPAVKFSNYVQRNVFKLVALISAAWLMAIPFLNRFFNVASPWLIAAFLPVIIMGLLASSRRGFLQGTLSFKFLGVVVAGEGFFKLLAAIVLVVTGHPSLVALSLPISIIGSWSLAVIFAAKIARAAEPDDGAPVYRFPRRFLAASILTGISSTAFLSMDVLLAKHYLSTADAGAYSLLSLVGNMVFFLGSLLSVFIITYVSKREGEGKSPQQAFYRLVAAIIVVVFVAWLGAGVFGRIFISILFGSKVAAIAPYLKAYTGALSLFTIAGAFVSYHLARKHYLFSLLAVSMAMALGAGIVLHHNSIASFVKVMLTASVINLAVVLAFHVLQRNGRFVLRNLVDLVDAFMPLPKDTTLLLRKRILVFNWRDTKHNMMGGAEIYIHELAKRWVESGNQVTLFCGNDGHSKRYEIVDGVRIIRRGGFYTVYIWAFLYYFTQFRGRFDVIVDCQNGVPFFTPLYAKEKIVAVLHHIHQDVFYKFLPRPLAAFAAVLENRLMPWAYEKIKFITVSESSKAEMEKWGVGKAGIWVVHPGVDLDLLEPGEKYQHPVVLYLGRLKAYKAIDVLIRAFWYVAAQVNQAKLIIAGEGEERGALQKLTDELGLAGRVIFTGKVSEDEKLELLQKAWVFCNPSMIEGWGITSIEANACGVPVVASNVPGLRESVQNPHTGFLVEYGNAEKFAEKIHTILADPKLREFMSHESLDWAKNFSWQKSAQKSLEVLNS